MVACIVGEGGSGGAVALAAADRILMFEHAVYSVISPEGCASILWRTGDKAADAAQAMKMTAEDLKSLGVIDQIVSEPVGGAHRDHGAAIASLGQAIEASIAGLSKLSRGDLKRQRHAKFLKMGQF
jgi:acetyl-CoA carboxylase carboxyl transferase subunit alpha